MRRLSDEERKARARERSRRYYQQNKHRWKEYHQNRVEKARESHRQYYHRNKDRWREYMVPRRATARAVMELIKELKIDPLLQEQEEGKIAAKLRARERCREYRRANKDRIAEQQKEYRARTREKRAEQSRAYKARKRAGVTAIKKDPKPKKPRKQYPKRIRTREDKDNDCLRQRKYQCRVKAFTELLQEIGVEL